MSISGCGAVVDIMLTIENLIAKLQDSAEGLVLIMYWTRLPVLLQIAAISLAILSVELSGL